MPAILPGKRGLLLFPQSKRGYSCWVGKEKTAVQSLGQKKRVQPLILVLHLPKLALPSDLPSCRDPQWVA